jgi:hypothetical protein
MDPIEIFFSAAVGAIAGGVVAEWRARSAEARAVKREQSTTFRDRQLRAIEETRLDYAQANEAALSLAGGRPATKEYYPNAQIWLINDAALIEETANIRHELVSRGGSGITEDDSRRLGLLLGRVSTALSRQEERILEGKPPAYPPVEEVEAVLRHVSSLHGIDQNVVDEMFGKSSVPPHV